MIDGLGDHEGLRPEEQVVHNWFGVVDTCDAD